MHRQALHRVAAHTRFPAAVIQHLAVDLQNTLGFVRDLGYSTLGLRQEGSKRVVLGYCWQNMAVEEHRCIELGHDLGVLLRPSQCHDMVRDQGGDVGVL